MAVMKGKPRQLELFGNAARKPRVPAPAGESGETAQYLSEKCGRSVEVVFTDNASTMIAVRCSPAYMVRLHWMFRNAPAEVLKALGVYLKWPRHKASNAVLARYIRENVHNVRKSSRKGLPARTKGRRFDLKAIYDRLNEKYFDGKLECSVTWGRAFRGRRRRSIRFGCVDQGGGVIRVNPSLDAGFVPEFFVEYIVYHEMLHFAVGGCTGADGRTLMHHGEFRRREREFERYEEAQRWQEDNLHRFIGKGK
jgi:hypothetical protein